MTTQSQNNIPLDINAIDEKVDRIKARLLTLKPAERHQDLLAFQKLFPVVNSLIESNVTQKDIIKALKDEGLTLHPSRFNELMQEAAKSHNTTYQPKGKGRKKTPGVSYSQEQGSAE